MTIALRDQKKRNEVQNLLPSEGMADIKSLTEKASTASNLAVNPTLTCVPETVFYLTHCCRLILQ